MANLLALPEYATASTTIGSSLRSLVKRRESSLCYRLKSIHYDSMFVQQAIKMLTSRLEKGTCLPEVYANLRNGLWYLPKFYGTAYFKSTDGHSHIWNFSFKRLNLHFALSAAQNNGAILVDSTRKGKVFPDSFSATVPIWCTVINRAVAQVFQKEKVPGSSNTQWDTELNAPAWVSKEEHKMIMEKLGEWVQELCDDHMGVVRSLATAMKKPLRAMWVSPESTLYPIDFLSLPFTPIVCISASRVVSSEEFRMRRSWPYIQGAGDDEENWANGLVPEVFWKYHKELLAIEQSDLCESRINDIKCQEEKSSKRKSATSIGGSTLAEKQIYRSGIIWMNLESLKCNSKENIVGLLPLEKNAVGMNVQPISGKDDLSNLFIFDISVGGCNFVGGFNNNSTVSKREASHVVRCPVPCDRKKGPVEKKFWMEMLLPSLVQFVVDVYTDNSNIEKKNQFVIVYEQSETFALPLITCVLAVLFAPRCSNNGTKGSVEEQIVNENLLQRRDELLHSKINKRSIRQCFAVVQMFVQDGSPPRRHMKYISEFFGSVYNGRRWFDQCMVQSSS